MESIRRTQNGIHFLKLKGSFDERVRAHASLLKSESQQGALNVLAKKNEWTIRRGAGALESLPWLQSAVVWAYNQVLIPLLSKQLSPQEKKMIEITAEELEMSVDQVRKSVFQPDGIMLLSRTSVMKYLLKHQPIDGFLGCTSVVAFNEWTKNRRMLVARNMDYPVVGPWEKNTTVLVHEPSEKGELRHVGVTTAGVHSAGLTSMNDQGLTLSAHAHFGTDVSFKGKPILLIGDQVISHAKTIGQAVDIIKKYRRNANWTFVISSAKENDAVAVEMSPDKVFVRHAQDGFLAHTNYFHNKEMQKKEALISGAVRDDFEDRYHRARKTLLKDKGDLTFEHFIKVLGDRVDVQCDLERVFGNTISVVTTVKSVVFDPGEQKLWVSNKSKSPTGLGEFVEFDINHFNWNEENSRSLPLYSPNAVKHTGLEQAIEHHREAYCHWHIKNDKEDFSENTLIALRKASRSYPEDGNLWVLNGIVAFKLNLIQEAMDCFEKALKTKLTNHILGVSQLMLARCYDLTNKRTQAKDLYRNYDSINEPRLRTAMRKGLHQKFRRNKISLLMLDLQYPDLFHY